MTETATKFCLIAYPQFRRPRKRLWSLCPLAYKKTGSPWSAAGLFQGTAAGCKSTPPSAVLSGKVRAG